MTQRGSVTERKRNAWRGMRAQCRGDCAGTASCAKRSAVRGIRIKHREELILRLLPICRGMIGRRAGSNTSAPRRPIVPPAREIASTPRWAYPPKDGRSDETGNAGMRSPIDENENLCIDSEYYSLQKRIKRHFLFSDAGFFTSASLKDDSWHHRQFQNAAFSIHAQLTA